MLRERKRNKYKKNNTPFGINIIVKCKTGHMGCQAVAVQLPAPGGHRKGTAGVGTSRKNSNSNGNNNDNDLTTTTNNNNNDNDNNNDNHIMTMIIILIPNGVGPHGVAANVMF